jgi:hypothetical protein
MKISESFNSNFILDDLVSLRGVYNVILDDEYYTHFHVFTPKYLLSDMTMKITIL